jgi:anaerobic selenocysteine-containing dehydrogenase
MTLVGRRDLRSNNSWMHNIEPLVRGRPRCTLWVHPDDAARLGLADGTPAHVHSRAGRVEIPVEVTDAIMPGVVSVPHGWGHDAPGIALRVASANAGVNSNLLADELAMDPLSGNAVLNGIPVVVEPRLRLGSREDGESSASGSPGERHAAAGKAGAATRGPATIPD